MHSLNAMRDAAWSALALGALNKDHPARHPTFMTLSQHGPEARTVVLRGWDDDTAEFHTDRQSAKVSELSANPKASLHVWIPEQSLQIRMRCVAELLHADPDRWQKIPAFARGVYGGSHQPGTELNDPADFYEAPERNRFTAVRAKAFHADLLYLGKDRHRRAIFEREGTDWRGRWVAP